MKLNTKKIKYFIADEKKAVKEYHKFGLHGLAYDEARHMKYLRKRYKMLKKRR